MNPITVELLRAATIQALQNKQDVSAHELLSLIKIAPGLPLKALPSESQGTIINGPDHDPSFWANYIRHDFIPFMTSNGRRSFTSIELNSWLSNRSDIELSAGDTEIDTENKPVWKKRVSKALARLKSQGILQAENHGKTYEILEHY